MANQIYFNHGLTIYDFQQDNTKDAIDDVRKQGDASNKMLHAVREQGDASNKMLHAIREQGDASNKMLHGVQEQLVQISEKVSSSQVSIQLIRPKKFRPTGQNMCRLQNKTKLLLANDESRYVCNIILTIPLNRAAVSFRELRYS